MTEPKKRHERTTCNIAKKGFEVCEAHRPHQVLNGQIETFTELPFRPYCVLLVVILTIDREKLTDIQKT